MQLYCWKDVDNQSRRQSGAATVERKRAGFGVTSGRLLFRARVKSGVCCGSVMGGGVPLVVGPGVFCLLCLFYCSVSTFIYNLFIFILYGPLTFFRPNLSQSADANVRSNEIFGSTPNPLHNISNKVIHVPLIQGYPPHPPQCSANLDINVYENIYSIMCTSYQNNKFL